MTASRSLLKYEVITKILVNKGWRGDYCGPRNICILTDATLTDALQTKRRNDLSLKKYKRYLYWPDPGLCSSTSQHFLAQTYSQLSFHSMPSSSPWLDKLPLHPYHPVAPSPSSLSWDRAQGDTAQAPRYYTFPGLPGCSRHLSSVCPQRFMHTLEHLLFHAIIMGSFPCFLLARL